jgi:hypothetical protein
METGYGYAAYLKMAIFMGRMSFPNLPRSRKVRSFS